MNKDILVKKDSHLGYLKLSWTSLQNQADQPQDQFTLGFRRPDQSAHRIKKIDSSCLLICPNIN